MPAKSLGLAALLLLAGVAPAQQSAPLPWSPGVALARPAPAPYWTPGPSAAAPVQQARFQPVPAPGVGPAPYDEKQAEANQASRQPWGCTPRANCNWGPLA